MQEVVPNHGYGFALRNFVVSAAQSCKLFSDRIVPMVERTHAPMGNRSEMIVGDPQRMNCPPMTQLLLPLFVFISDSQYVSMPLPCRSLSAPTVVKYHLRH
jgi:hypothetical protein